MNTAYRVAKLIVFLALLTWGIISLFGYLSKMGETSGSWKGNPSEKSAQEIMRPAKKTW